MLKRAVAALLAGAALAAGAQQAAAADAAYPVRPVRMVVPFAPGGSDIVARMLAPKLGEKLGQPFVVENRPGAGSVVGSEIVAKSAPDGYVLLFCTSSLSTTAAYLKKPPYDAVHDFAAVAQIGWLPFALVTHPALPVKTVKEFIALARRKPGQLFYPSPGTGSIGHLANEFFAKETGIKVTHVAYKGSGPMITALLTGEVQFAMPNVSAALAVIRAGKVRTLGVAAPRRIAFAPDLGTLRENGVDLVAGPWYGVVAPRGTPQQIVELLNREIIALVQSPDMREKLVGRGMEVEVLAPPAFAAVIKSDVEKWAGVMRAAGISQE